MRRRTCVAREHNWRERRLHRRLQKPLIIILLVCGVISAPPAASAHHYTVTKTDYRWNPGEGDKFNGVRVFLSAPRHKYSGNRGECLADGAEENINGRYHNTQAAGGGYMWEQTSTAKGRNFVGRGFKTFIGRNPRDDGRGYGTGKNVTLSNNWGAKVHLVTHSNASNGCPSSANYWLVMFRESRDRSVRLARSLRYTYSRGGGNHPSGEYYARDELEAHGDRLVELGVKAPFPAYMEIAFHDNRAGELWMSAGNGAAKTAWRMGWAVDRVLQYPR